MRFTSKNPVFDAIGNVTANRNSNAMTIGGSVFKTFIGIAFILLGAYISYSLIGTISWFKGLWIGSGVAAFLVAMLLVYRRNWSIVLMPLYATLKGIFLGAISMNYEAATKGIIGLAITLTIGVLFAMLILYRLGWIKVSRKFRSVLISVTSAIALIYLVSFVLRLLNMPPIPYIHDSGWIGIIFSSIVVVVAALNFLLDFQFIERGISRNYPQKMEWYAAFGLLVTIIWQYMSILRIIRKLTRFKNSW